MEKKIIPFPRQILNLVSPPPPPASPLALASTSPTFSCSLPPAPPVASPPGRRAFRARLARAHPPHPCAPLPAPRARAGSPAHAGPRPPQPPPGRAVGVLPSPPGRSAAARTGCLRAGRAAAAAAAAGPGASGGGLGSGVELSLGLQRRGAPGGGSPGGRKGRPGREVPEQPFSLDLGEPCPPHLVFRRPLLTPQSRPLTGGGGGGGLRGAAMPLPR